MKLTRSKLIEVIRRKNEGQSSYQVRKIANVSVRRINQVWDYYIRHGIIPDIGKRTGRPSKPIEPGETEMVRQSYLKYRVSADTLERLIWRDFDKKIGHNRIHRILIDLGFAKQKKKKDIRKKSWIRYERRHSLTAVHIDWHFDGKKYVFAVIDDASRKQLALIECNSATTEQSIAGMEIALLAGDIKQCISDHGAQFISNVDGNSKFKAYLKSKEIKQILCRVKHPQSNGKIERWFDVYDRHRSAFATAEEFLYWYNEIRPHRSLHFEVLETPAQAFVRKMKTEA